jgi:hypothetical protein
MNLLKNCLRMNGLSYCHRTNDHCCLLKNDLIRKNYSWMDYNYGKVIGFLNYCPVCLQYYEIDLMGDPLTMMAQIAEEANRLACYYLFLNQYYLVQVCNQDDHHFSY